LEAIFQPGLKGRIFRNWIDGISVIGGNEYEGIWGLLRFLTATQVLEVYLRKAILTNSIAIRGPESSNYQFIDGKKNFLVESFFKRNNPSVYLRFN